ncbi:MAG: signal peptidase I [bacterium]
MTDEKGHDYRLKVTVNPDRVVSDGKTEVSVKCTILELNGKPVREEAEVELFVQRTKITDKKRLKRGSATFKFIPARPTGRTYVRITSPFGDASAPLTITPTFNQWFKDLFFTLLWSFIIIMLVVRPFIIQTYFIPSSSMEPTLYRGDRIIANMFMYRFTSPRRGDIAIFHFPGSRKTHRIPLPFRPIKYNTYKDFIKRIIAVEGDTVEVRDGVLWLNGAPLKEPYIKSAPLYTMSPKVVPKGSVFVFGDNRNNSQDSHVWGALERKNIRAKAMLLFWPMDRLSLFHSPKWAKSLREKQKE